ncbi:hypothetical protein [Maribacter sp. 2307ULW6-5]|uniref:hypothetical protein n=1 Tax=Maribacter sp. 2307ULW6-5 TaxID=3386275 RepID=UPI0039BC7E0D
MKTASAHLHMAALLILGALIFLYLEMENTPMIMAFVGTLMAGFGKNLFQKKKR